MHVFLREEHLYILEIRVVWCHTIILQTLHSRHTFFRQILLSKHFCQLLCTVITVVNEDNDIAFFNRSVDFAVVDCLDKFIGHALVVTLLHGFNQVIGLFSFALHKQIISLFHAVPAFISVHCIEPANDTCDVSTIFLAAFLYVFNEALAASWVGISPVHEAMHIYIFEPIFLTYLYQLEEMIE